MVVVVVSNGLQNRPLADRATSSFVGILVNSIWLIPLLVNCLFTAGGSVSGSTWTLASVYGPCDDSRKCVFLVEIESIRGRWSNCWCICGDFNLIRFPHENTGVTKFTPIMWCFSDCISFLGPPCRVSNLLGPTLIDRFLVSTE